MNNLIIAMISFTFGMGFISALYENHYIARSQIEPAIKYAFHYGQSQCPVDKRCITLGEGLDNLTVLTVGDIERLVSGDEG